MDELSRVWRRGQGWDRGRGLKIRRRMDSSKSCDEEHA